jgi:hypothetical protein
VHAFETLLFGVSDSVREEDVIKSSLRVEKRVR